MTDIEALRARMREAAENATPGPWTRRDTPDYAEMIGEDESRPLALVGKPEDADFIALASPANVKALDAEITRLREDLDRVTRERDALLETPGGYWWPSWRKMIDAMVKPGPRCRDCADYDGRCGGDGPPCDPTEHAIENYRKSVARAEAAEAALAKRDEEVARLREAIQTVRAKGSRIEREANAFQDVGASLEAKIRIKVCDEILSATLTQEPTNAER